MTSLTVPRDGKSVNLERLDSRQFDRFRDLIYENCGIRFDEKKVTLLSNRIRARVKSCRLENFDEYLQFITSRSGLDEVERFINAITTNETFFFRTNKHFDWLQEQLITDFTEQRRKHKRPASLRIMSAGCATGAEPYSIAICLAENAYRLRGWDLQILGTDISSEALQIAREGIFKPRTIESVDEKILKRYFQQDTKGNLWHVRPRLKELVTFQHHNLMNPLSEPAFDCIFIRNVLIYFDKDSKRVVLNNLLNSLNSGGYLVIGPSEGIYNMLPAMRKVSPLVYQKSDHPQSYASPRHGDA